ncbi:MAG: NF038143 family protein, partial [Chlorobiales bacterium]|nr:NF038143 family protein [Chlorobiales bacterium]
ILSRDRQGFYTDKVRRKQLLEIELLVDHYLKLIRAGPGGYQDLLASAYPDPDELQDFYADLEAREKAVIQATLATMRKGSKKDRRAWFTALARLNSQVREEDLDSLLGD